MHKLYCKTTRPITNQNLRDGGDKCSAKSKCLKFGFGGLYSHGFFPKCQRAYAHYTETWNHESYWEPAGASKSNSTCPIYCFWWQGYRQAIYEYMTSSCLDPTHSPVEKVVRGVKGPKPSETLLPRCVRVPIKCFENVVLEKSKTFVI